AVLSELGLRPHRSLDDDLKLTDQSMSYAGTSTPVATGDGRPPKAVPRPSANGTPAVRAAAPATRAHSEPCPCQSHSAAPNGRVEQCGCLERRRLVTESYPGARSNHATTSRPLSSHGRPDFTWMSPAERLAYHRERLGLGR